MVCLQSHTATATALLTQVSTRAASFLLAKMFCLPLARWAGDYKTHSVRACMSVCVMFLKRAVHHTGCFSLAFSMFYDLIAHVFSFDAVFSGLGP